MHKNSGQADAPKTRDGANISPWQTGLSQKRIPPTAKKTQDIIYDVVIAGTGITGLTTALMLQLSGKQCVVVDAHSSGFGTTGGTSAHINTFADTTFSEAEKAFGKEGAQLFAAAINDGFDIIRHNVETLKIACDLEPKKAYVYAEDKEQADELDELYAGCKKVGLEIAYTNDAPTPIKYKKAIVVDGQAQFHPMKYLHAIQTAYLKAGGIIVEQSMVTDVTSKDGIHTVKATKGEVKAKNVVYATHIPPGVNVFSFRCAPYRSYVLAVSLKDKKYPDGLVYDMQEPYHYFRTHEIDGQQLLLAGGNDHKTGHDDPEKAFEQLEAYVRKHYKVGAVKYKWSSQYYVPVDGFPYIGQMPGKAAGIYCATGYNGNGMMLGSIAARIICDLVIGKKNKYAELFSPGRIKPVAGFKEFVKEGADVVRELIASRLSAHEVDFLKRVRKDSGKVIEFEGKKMAIYRDADGNIHALDPVCTHAGCVVNWNKEEKSWDCPCHGARYDISGAVLNGPAERPLGIIKEEE